MFTKSQITGAWLPSFLHKASKPTLPLSKQIKQSKALVSEWMIKKADKWNWHQMKWYNHPSSATISPFFCFSATIATVMFLLATIPFTFLVLFYSEAQFTHTRDWGNHGSSRMLRWQKGVYHFRLKGFGGSHFHDLSMSCLTSKDKWQNLSPYCATVYFLVKGRIQN